MRKILLTNNDLPTVNIGDYIQSLAAKQYFNDNNFICWNRDNLINYKGKSAKAVMNAWFTYKPLNFPPSAQITPLFVSFHLNSKYGKSILHNPKVIDYFKHYEPIGCRDFNTVNLLKENGINAYFSSCLTTTLDFSYKSKTSSREKIYIVDPLSYMPNGKSLFELFCTFIQYLINFKEVNRIIRSYKNNNKYSLSFSKIGIGRFFLAVKSFLLLKEVFSPEILTKAEFITQFNSLKEYPTDADRFKRAEELLKKYSEARLVITSRIHCALPCLGLETPVVFLQNEKDSLKSSCRLGGLIHFFHLIKYKGSNMVESFKKKPGRIGLKDILTNKSDYKVYAEELKNKVNHFFENEK